MPRRAFTIQKKLDAIELASKTSRANAAKVLSVDPKRIREWCKLKEKFLRASKKAKRLEGGGRNVIHDAMEDKLVRWISAQRSKSLRVSRKMIQSEARRIVQEDDSSSTFIASYGWLRKFLKRNRLSLRKRTTVAQKTPEHVKQKIIDFLAFVHNLRKNCGYATACIGAADETSVWMDPIQDTTIEKTGKHL
jgi:hypothetical protein